MSVSIPDERTPTPAALEFGRWLFAQECTFFNGSTKLETIPDAVAALRMTVNELGALYLGGVTADTLVAAGRITELTPGAAAAADALLRVDRAPWLSVWY